MSLKKIAAVRRGRKLPDGVRGLLVGSAILVMHTVHLFPFHEETGRATATAYVTIERLAARWCDRLVTVGDFQRQWALDRGIGSPEQVVSIPNGVLDERASASRAPAEIRAELGIGHDAFMVLSTGRLAPQKGLEHLIRAAALLRSELPALRVVLAGDGPLRGELARLVSDLGLEDVVRILGFRANVGDLLAASDLVALPSLWEGLSISLLEAMAAEKPVVTTSIESNREVTNEGEAALLVPPKHPASLAAAIRTLAMFHLARRRARDAIVLSDEGTLLSSYNLFVATKTDFSEVDIARFADLAPVPDLVVYVRVPVESLVERARSRPDPRRQHVGIGAPEIEADVRRTVELFDLLVQTVPVAGRVTIVESSDLDEEGRSRLANEVVNGLLSSLPPERPSAGATTTLDSSLEEKV